MRLVYLVAALAAVTPAWADSFSAQPTGVIPKLSAVPASGPGAGICQEMWVPSNLASPTGGTAGTCSQIVMCGTSASFQIETLNVGNGC